MMKIGISPNEVISIVFFFWREKWIHTKKKKRKEKKSKKYVGDNIYTLANLLPYQFPQSVKFFFNFFLISSNVIF